MPLWSRRRDPGTPAGPDDLRGPPSRGADNPTPDHPAGTLACSREGCADHTGVPCRYVDRRGRRCASAWCSAHQLVVQGRPYCTRHGGVVRAVIAGGMSSAPLPDLENRAPSLIQFVGEAVNEPMIAMLRSSWPGDLETGVFPVKLAYLGQERRRSWSRKWTRFSHRGDEVAVSLVVAEDHDELVIVRVDSDTAAELIPPWISHRSTAGDEQVRGAFYAAIVEAARIGVENAHAREATLRERQSESWISTDPQT